MNVYEFVGIPAEVLDRITTSLMCGPYDRAMTFEQHVKGDHWPTISFKGINTKERELWCDAWDKAQTLNISYTKRYGYTKQCKVYRAHIK